MSNEPPLAPFNPSCCCSHGVILQVIEEVLCGRGRAGLVVSECFCFPHHGIVVTVYNLVLGSDFNARFLSINQMFVGRPLSRVSDINVPCSFCASGLLKVFSLKHLSSCINSYKDFSLAV